MEGEERKRAEGGACVTIPEGQVLLQRPSVRELRFAAMYGFRNVQVLARFSIASMRSSKPSQHMDFRMSGC